MSFFVCKKRGREGCREKERERERERETGAQLSSLHRKMVKFFLRLFRLVQQIVHGQGYALALHILALPAFSLFATASTHSAVHVCAFDILCPEREQRKDSLLGKFPSNI
jgi:hypothetical protein